MTTHLRTCPLCEAMCGLEIETEGEQVVRIRGDRNDVWSHGFICPKGATLGELHHDPDRLRTPLIRHGEEWHEATWDEAFARCEELLRPIIDEHGIEAVTAYMGNPNVHNYSLSRYSGAVAGLAGMPVTWSAGTVDQWPKNLVCADLYGNPWAIPIPDVANTDLLIIMGANPQASNGSLLSFPDLIGELDRIRARGGRSIVIDPRRTGTADKADEWLPIIPGTDAAFLFAIVNVLDTESLIDLRHLDGMVHGIDRVLLAAADFTPESVADWCGIDAERIRSLARELADAERAVIYGRIGLCCQEFGTLATWLVDTINVLTGRLGAEGGVRFARPAIVPIAQTARGRGPARRDRWRTRVNGVPEVLGQAPLAELAAEITTPGEGKVRALITIAGNPVLSAPDAAAIDDAFAQLDAMISIDIYLNETTRHADVILPGLSPLEQPHMDEALWGFALRSVARWSPPIFPPGERPAEWEIALRLGAILAGIPSDMIDLDALDDQWFKARAARHGLDPADIDTGELRGPDRIADLTVRVSPWGDGYGQQPGGLDLEAVMAAPHGIDLGESSMPLDQVLRTHSGGIELAHDEILADIDRLRTRMGDGHPELLLIGRRHVRSNNSWLHNVPGLMRGRDRSTLLMHPEDAGGRALTDGATVSVRTSNGEVTATLEISDEVRRGVVSLPHGWGHDADGARLAVASERPGVNTNVLMARGVIDVPSGNAAVNGVPVEVHALG